MNQCGILHFFFALFLCLIYLPYICMSQESVMKVIDFSNSPFTEKLENGDLETIANNQFREVNRYGNGYQIKQGEGRNDSTAAYCENPDASQRFGLQWSFQLNQKSPLPVRFTGWSRAEDVEGSSDSSYSLYIDLVYQDGTPSWGHNVPFSTGSHGWEEETLFVVPDKPIRTLSCYALFRNHKGRVWFDDFSIQILDPPEGMFRFDGLQANITSPISTPQTTESFQTNDGMTIGIDPDVATLTEIDIDGQNVPLSEGLNGMMVRDVGEGSDYYAFEEGQCPSLSLSLQLDIEEEEHAISFKGRLTDQTQTPRVISLVFAIPVDAVGWQWGEHLRSAQAIEKDSEYATFVDIGTGTNGKLSRYPFATVFSEQIGLGLGIDLGQPCQWRLGYSSGARALYLVMDFGLHPSTEQFPSAAPFAFVLYRINPKWGFRSAADQYYKIFPTYFEVRSKDQGIWMPFTDVSTIAGWQDFGFRYHEGTNNIPFDDRSGILSFRYSEPSTWWMRMPAETPRTVEEALEMVNDYADSSGNANLRNNAQALLSSGMYDENGNFQMQFRDEPWCDGAVFSLNPSPHLPGEVTEAKMMWNDQIAERLYGENTKGEQDGEYLDSLEGYVTADLNFREDHFRYTTVPLTFTMDTHRPVIHKAFSQYEFTRHIGEEMHEMGKLLFANSVPNRFSFLCPWLDIMGTETNWIRNRQFEPDTDERMNYRRTLCGQKPFLFLMNTRFENMTYEYVERYFQYCLFYGMFPSMFSHNAAENPYWKNPQLYNRDRPLFKKYLPIIQEVAEAGWQPITHTQSNQESIWIERFGPSKEGIIYLTVMNAVTDSKEYTLAGENILEQNGEWEELLTGKEGRWEGDLNSVCEPASVQVFRIKLINSASLNFNYHESNKQ